jgi:hypothetical protein
VLTDYGEPETIGITEPLRFHRVALAFHLYNGSPATLLARITGERAHTRTDQRGGPPWIMDEFGADNDNAATGDTVSLADRAGVSWTYWAALQLHDPTGNPFEALIDERTRKPYHAKALALAVPYPAATAGTPGAQSFNARTNTFNYRYWTARGAKAPTEIIVPSYVFTLGYSVHARGGKVVSAKNAELLEVTANPGAGQIQITVKPRR